MAEHLSAAAVAYFRQRPVLQQLALGFCERYRSLGHWGGTVRLGTLTATEQEALSLFLRVDLADREVVTISYAAFAAAWAKTRFAVWPLEQFLAELYPQELLTKKEAAAQKENARLTLLDTICREFPMPAVQQWISALRSGRLRLPHPELAWQPQFLRRVAGALAALPTAYERLPFFANRVCGNPHGFDWETDAGKGLLQALAFLAGDMPCRSVEDKNEVLYRYRLLRDDILNFATEAGLAAWQDGQELAYWRAAAGSRSPLNLPFREIVRADRIALCDTAEGSFPVSIVENSGVFSALLDALPADEPLPALLCLHGQLKTASWALLDRLLDSGAEFWYSGDFDPEGLQIAQKLRQRYPGRVRLWHFGLEEYERTEIQLDAVRIKKLDGIADEELMPIAGRMHEWRCAFYQESLLPCLLADLVGKWHR